MGTLTFLAGAIAGASANIQLVFSTFSTIADQALFLTDLSGIFRRETQNHGETWRPGRSAPDSAWIRIQARLLFLRGERARPFSGTSTSR